MSLLVVMNRGDSGLGMFTRELQTRFEQIEVCYREEILQLKVQSFPRALILLGSDWSVCDPSVTHQVDAEVSLLKKLSEREVPVLGVCYGAQLIAHAFGGSVRRGWTEVHADRDHSVLSGKWMQWHYDSLTAPPGFEVLATSQAAVQCIRRGRVVGVQFHPEFDDLCLATWLARGGDRELECLGILPENLVSNSREEIDRARTRSAGFLSWFLEVVAVTSISS
jgi:GMP synthase-like glutamine amidotransferase